MFAQAAPLLRRLLLASAATLAAVTAAPAQSIGRSAADVVTVSLVEGWRTAPGRHMAGIRIALAPGWKTYWRAPGEAGVPTVLRLTEADGITGMSIRWPRPEVFFTNGMRSIGYRDDIVLPVEFAMDGNGTYRIAGRLDLGVCQDVCMPVTLDISGSLLPDGTRDGAIAAALSDRPLSAAEAGAGAARCSVEPIADGLRITVSAPVPALGNDETLVLEHADPTFWVSEAVTTRRGGQIVGVADVVPPHQGPFALNRSDLRVTIIGSRMAVELDDCTG